jgi:dienelactone hydrolase
MKRQSLSRRQALRLAGGTVLGLAGSLRAAAPPVPLNRFPRMVQEYFFEQVRRIDQQNQRIMPTLCTKSEAEAYIRDRRARIRRCFGPEPERTPLRPRITGVLVRDGYQIEKLIFESRPDFLVTANLYVPRGRKSPLPAVVGSCGHAAEGKAAEPYQSFAQGLTRQGYVVLIFDPIGQGERLQYTDRDLHPRHGIGVSEHLLAGNQQFLVGEFFGAWRAWDGIRALDYLLSRPEVDPRHVGITGNSGGGTMTTWLCGLDQRWTMAAPGCFVTTFRRNLENELPADTEQCPPAALAVGLDHCDFLAALAPKPIVILAKERDFFDVRGAIEAHARLKRLYSLLGKADQVHLHIGPGEHGYTKDNREAMYRWFNRAAGIAATDQEPVIHLEKEAALWCTPHGQVADLPSRTVFAFTRDRSRELARHRPALAGMPLVQAVTAALKLPTRPVEPPEYRILRPLPSRNYPRRHATTYAVETEPGIFALVTRLADQPLYARPPQGPEQAILYVAHHSADAELRDEPLVRDLLTAHKDVASYACDVRGIGESRPDTCGADQFLRPYGSDYFYAIHSIMLDRPYVGQKTHDVLRVLDWLASCGHRRVHLAARGWGTLPAAFAGLLAENVERVTLKGALDSYAAVAEAEDYDWPLSAFVPNVLALFDLPDCYLELEKRKKLHRVPAADSSRSG